MKIAILGTGSVGRAFAEKLIGLGHSVTMGTRDVSQTLSRKEPNSPGAFLESHPSIKLATFADAAASCDMAILVTKGTATLDVVSAAGAKNLEGKVVIDITNPLDFSKGKIGRAHV